MNFIRLVQAVMVLTIFIGFQGAYAKLSWGRCKEVDLATVPLSELHQRTYYEILRSRWIPSKRAKCVRFYFDYNSDSPT